MPKKRKNVSVEDHPEEDDYDTQALHSLLPCREKQISDLLTLMGEPYQYTVSSIFMYGHASCGKSVVLESIMEYYELPHVVVNCVECYTTNILYQEVLRGLYFHSKADDARSEFVPPKKCENTNDFVRFLKKMLTSFFPNETTYIILSKADRLRDREVNLIPALLNLQEISGCNICVIFESEVTWEKYYNGIAGKSPFIMFFPDYTKEELQKIITLLRPPDSSEEFYKDYIGIVLSVFYTACRDLRELRHLAEINFPIYCEPIKKEEATESDKHKLWKNIEPYLKNALHSLYLREISSSEWTKLHVKSTEDEISLPSNFKDLESVTSTTPKRAKSGIVELPFYSKFLVIAAYLASYNPVKTDLRFFVKSAGKNKKTLKSMKKDEQKSAHLRGPKAFPLDRLMAIFYSIVDGKVPPTANIFSQITSLVSLHLLSQVGHEDQIDSPKYKCVVSLDFIQAISRTVNFDVIRYLYDFV
ncbi:origin recognition complex subunit 5-like [Styela clava]